MGRSVGVEGREEQDFQRPTAIQDGGKCNFSYKRPLMHLVAKLCLTETHVLSCTFCNLTTEQKRGETRLKEESTMLTNNIAHIKLCIFSLSPSLGHIKVKLAPEKRTVSQTVI